MFWFAKARELYLAYCQINESEICERNLTKRVRVRVVIGSHRV